MGRGLGHSTHDGFELKTTFTLVLRAQMFSLGMVLGLLIGMVLGLLPLFIPSGVGLLALKVK